MVKQWCLPLESLLAGASAEAEIQNFTDARPSNLKGAKQ